MLKTAINHVPDTKPRHIHSLVEIIHDEFDAIVNVAAKAELELLVPSVLNVEQSKKAYIEARNSKHYDITAEALEWPRERVKALNTISRTLCLNHIDKQA